MVPQQLISATKQETKSTFWAFMFAFVPEGTVNIRQLSLKLIENNLCCLTHSFHTMTNSFVRLNVHLIQLVEELDSL